MIKPFMALLIGTLVLSGCGRMGTGGWNPLGWTGRASSTPASLAPEGGYLQDADARPPIPQILGAEWHPLAEGRLLVVYGLAPVKGYHSADLVTATPQPGDRLEPDVDGVLRLRFVATPPLPGNPAARLAADPSLDTIKVALPLSFRQLDRLVAIEIAGGDRTLLLRR